MKNIPLKYKVITVAILAAIIFVVIFSGGSGFRYKLKTDETLKAVLAQNDVVDQKILSEILRENDKKYRFVDLRTPSEFVKGHIENAVNIPSHDILSTDNQKFLKDKNFVNILYHADQVSACGPWMLLKQIGFENNKILLGGYQIFKRQYVEKDSTLTEDMFYNEKAKYDFAEIAKQTSGSQVPTQTTTAPASTNAKSTIAPKKKKGGGGGC